MDNEEGESKPKPFVRTHGPISSNRHNLPLRTLPPSVDVPRSGTIEHLLRREFGTLAPPPAPSVSGGSIMQDALERQARIKARRDEYQAMDADSLQKLVEEARDKERKELEERIEALRANREGAWPAWAAQDLWSENEFASICCGLLPNESRTDSLASQVSQASESISRGVLSKTLQFIPRSDADTAAFMYGTARHFVPVVAAEWAATRFPSFPASLLDAIRARAAALVSVTPSPASSDSAEGKPLTTRERNTLLRIIAALSEVAEIDTAEGGSGAIQIEAAVAAIPFDGPKEKAIRAVLKQVRELTQ